MLARRLIAGAAYGPKELALLQRALEKCWSDAEHEHHIEPRRATFVRLQLARALLTLAARNIRDIDDLEIRALAMVFPADYCGAPPTIPDPAPEPCGN